jgi:hypothetical protein
MGMLDALDQFVPFSALVWAFPIIFLIHDGEELLVLSRCKQVSQPRPAPIIAERGWLYRPWTHLFDMPRSRFVAAAAFIFVLLVIVTLRTISALRAGDNPHLFTLAIVMLLINAFTHITHALLVRRCTPGVATSVPVLLPYCTYTLHRLSLLGSGVSTLDGRVLAVAAVALLVMLVTAHLFARLIVR